MALDTSSPQPARQPGETSATDPANWQYIRDLPTPPEVAERIEAKCRGQGWLWRWWNKFLIESWTKDLKLQYYYAGKTVALISTESRSRRDRRRQQFRRSGDCRCARTPLP